MGKLDRFDEFVPATPWVNPWQPDGSFAVDYDLLHTLLDVAVGTSQRAGVVAGAVDVWAAEELRRAGMDPDEVWPRRTEPRVLPRDVGNFVRRGLTQQLRTDVEARYTSPGARKALPAEAHVLGSAFTKQADVVVASWAAGVELLVSTKTMLSSYQKNLRNRFEEGYGDAKNLRGRHPLASLGFLFVVGADVPDTSLDFTVDMLRKLTAEPDVYDCACLLVVDGATRVADDPEEDRDEADEPPALLTLPEGDEEGELDDTDEDEEVPSGGVRVSIQQHRVPPDLSAEAFFERLLSRALERMPVAVYATVRDRQRAGRTA